MLKRLIALTLVFSILLTLPASAAVPTDYPPKLSISVQEDPNSHQLTIILESGVKYLGFWWDVPLIIAYNRDIITWNDVQAHQFFSCYSAQEYYNAFKVLENINSDNVKDISYDAMKSYFKEKLGLGNILEEYPRYPVTTYLKYIFLLAMLERIYKSIDNTDRTDMIMMVPVNFEAEPLLFDVIDRVFPDIGRASSLKEVQDKLRELNLKAQRRSVNDYVERNIYENYVKGITEREIKSYAYKDIERTLYTITWSDLKYSEYIFLLQDVLDCYTFDISEILRTYWSRIVQYHNDNPLYITSDDLIQLSYVVLGRGSRFSLYNASEWAIPSVIPDTGIEPDLNAKSIAMQQASYILNSINDKYSLADNQLVTIAYRLQYHYHAMQTDYLSFDGIDEIKRLSTTEEGAPFTRYFAPADLDGIGILQGHEYVRFMNVVSEIALYRQTIIDAGLENIKPNTTISGSTKLRMKQVNSMKAAVSFLESLPYKSFQPIIDFWYSRDTTTGKSLEDLYLNCINYASNEDFFEGDIEEDEAHPMSRYFDLEQNKLNIYIRMGIAQSSLFVPLQTNVYEPYTYSQIQDEGFYKDWHDIWGYHRKVLYIDTSLSAAVNLYNTGKSGKLRVATLKDILDPEKDIVLYTDTNFYNRNKLKTLEEQYQDAVEKFEEAKETLETASDVVQMKWGEIAKRELTKAYNAVTDKFNDMVLDLSQKLTPYHKTLAKEWNMTEEDIYFMSGAEIDEYLSQKNYSYMKTLAVQSAILRDTTKHGLIDYMKRMSKVELPVFISSKTLCKLPGVNLSEKNSFFNYILLKNIEENVKVEYRSTLDYNSPIYMDVYGNILTESGYVVVPAMANATLQKTYTPYTAAFLSTYGNVYKAPKEYKDVMDELSDIVELSEDETVFEIQSLVEGDAIDLQHLSLQSENTKKRLYTIARYALDSGSLDTPRYIVNVIIEVMRGAPIEFIDKEAEGIAALNQVSMSGIVQAVKLDALRSALKSKNQNSMVSIPNLAFMSGVEYVILFIYKVTLLVLIILLFIQIFAMGMTASITLRSVGKLLLTVVLTISLIYVVPVVYETTYYQTNKLLLQNETLYMAMLNLEKEETGVEVGMLEVQEPVVDSELYIKLTDLNIPWTRLFSDIMYASIDTSFSKLYTEYAKTNLVYGLEGFQAKGDAIYISTQDLFRSSTVMFEPKFQTIYQYTQGDVPASFFTPYYVFLDALIRNTNQFNSERDLYSYSSTLYKGGKLKSVGLIKEYLTSDWFMSECEDILYLRQIYGVEQDTMILSPFTEEDVSFMRESQWCNTNMTDSEVRLRIEKLDAHARKFVAENKALIGKISDETFLKIMALSMAIEHNKLFGIGVADSIEIYNISPDDLVRLSILPRDKVMRGSPYSYSRYIFENAGVVGIYLAAILEVVLFISGWVKPIITVIIFITLYVSIFINKLVLNKDNKNIKGYIKLVVILSLTNLLYSLLLKVSISLPKLGLGPSICLIGLIVFHVIFIALFVWITSIPVRNWRDLGDARFSEISMDVREFIVGNNVLKRIEERRENPTNKGWEYYKLLHNNDEQRVYKIIHEEDI